MTTNGMLQRPLFFPAGNRRHFNSINSAGFLTKFSKTTKTFQENFTFAQPRTSLSLLVIDRRDLMMMTHSKRPLTPQNGRLVLMIQGQLAAPFNLFPKKVQTKKNCENDKIQDFGPENQVIKLKMPFSFWLSVTIRAFYLTIVTGIICAPNAPQ